MKELTRFDIAACKRIAANTKTLRNKVERLDAKIEELTAQRNNYLSEITMWEAPIVEKYGHSIDSILDGSYLNATDSSEDFDCKVEVVYPEDVTNEYPEDTMNTDTL